jgi:hypothetical protein
VIQQSQILAGKNSIVKKTISYFFTMKKTFHIFNINLILLKIKKLLITSSFVGFFCVDYHCKNIQVMFSSILDEQYHFLYSIKRMQMMMAIQKHGM